MHLVSPAHGGLAAALALLAAVLVASGVYAAALRRPPSARVIAAGSALAVAGALFVPALFSADAFAYAYYGDLLLHGLNPYAHDPALLDDPLARAAVAAWNGHVPPRCVYGPVAVALAAAADAAGNPWGPAGAIAFQRVAAGAALGGCIGLFFRLVRDGRPRVAFAWNPVVIWSAGEGHNDAAMLLFVLAAFVLPRRGAALVALGTLVKAPALLALAAFRRLPQSLGAAAVVVAGYAPLAAAVLAAPRSTGVPADWESPLGLVAAAIGRPAALTAAILVVGAVTAATRGRPPLERAGAFAFAAWNVLPNAYPWYALWIMPLAAANMRSPWSAPLLVAALCATIRGALDAMFANGTALHGEMIAMQYLPPLAVRAAAALRRPAIVAGLTVLVVGAAPAAGFGQTTPAPAPAPGPVQAVPPPQPAPTATTTPPPSPGPSAPVPAPVLSPTAAPYAYVVTPPPATAPPGDGPQILEVALNDRTVHAGGPLLARVRTSSNVVGVEARALGRFIAIPQAAPGVFTMQYTLPGGIPFWLLNKNYDVVIAAATADGRQTTLTVPLTLSR